MSTYGVNINFKVVGQNKVDRAITSAKKLEASVSRIRSIDLSKAVGGASGDRIAKALGQLRRYAQQVNQLGKTIGDTPAQQLAAANAFKEVADNAKVGSFTFEQFTKAAFKQSEGLKASEKAAENVIRRMKGMQTVEERDAQLQRRAIRLRALRAKKERELAAAENKRRRRQTAGNAASSAIIGGAFPLLFGQTGAAAVGGSIGGLAGGLLGGQFGFALSIAGTAVGQAIEKVDTFNLSLAKLNGQIKILGSDSEFTGKEINKLANSLKITKEEAFEVANAFTRFGKERGKLLAQTIGQDTGGLFAIANVKDQATALKAIEAISKNITFEKQAELIASLKNNTAAQIQLKLQEILLQAKFEERKATIEEIGLRERLLDIFKRTALLRLGLFNQLKNVESPNDRVKRELQELEEQFAKLKNIFDGVIGSIQSVQTETDNLQFSTTGAIENIERELKKLQDPMFQLIQISGAIGNAFGESFKGIVKGSMTAQDALRNLFMRTADAFLDMAAQMIAKQIQMQILGIGLNFFGNNPYGVKKGQSLYDIKTPSRFTDMTVGERANGGTAQGGKSYLVGERGPEMFTPGVTGTVTPNHAMGSTNIVVNVDASGSSVEGDEDRGRELGRLISVAVQSELVQQKRPGGLLA